MATKSEVIPYFGSQLSKNISQERSGNVLTTETSSVSNAANKFLSSIKLLPASVNIQQLQIAKSYFKSIGTPESTASTMAILLNDVAVAQKTSVMKLIGEAKSNTGTLFGADTYSVLNLLRHTVTQIGTAASISNSNSYRARSILY